MKNWLRKNIVQLLSLIALLFLAYMAFVNNDLLIESYESFSFWLYPENENRNGELFKIVLSIFGALGILFGIYISLRRAKAIEKGVEKQGDAINIQSEQIGLTRKSQTDERFKNAVEHLGNDKQPIILGGLAELHQIAKENKDEYAEIIFNILCSYIRSNSKSNRSKIIIQTIVNYLFTGENINPYKGFKADLQDSNLLGINFQNANLEDSNLSNSQLSSFSDSSLKNTDLSRTIFFLSHINKVDFTNAELYNTIFFDSTIQDCEFNIKKDFPKLHFINCYIKNVKFDECIMSDWSFMASEIIDSSFNNTEIVSTSFAISKLLTVDFLNVELFGGNDFRGTILNGVRMENIIITKSNFRGCKKSGDFYRTLFKDKLSRSIRNDTDTSGIEFINTRLVKCDTGVLLDKDVEEIIEVYEKYQTKIFPKKSK